MAEDATSSDVKRQSSSNGKQATQTWTVLRPVYPEMLQRMLLYNSSSAYYLLGYNGEETQCRLLIFSKSSHRGSLKVEEDPQVLTPSEASDLLEEIDVMESANGYGLDLLCEAFGILGCFHFLEGYYLFLITKRTPLGSLAGHTVYGIADTALIPLNFTNECVSERRYRRLLLSGVDLTKDFFFSYTYNLSYTVQHNLMHQDSVDPFDCIYVWNEYLTRDLRTTLNDSKWVLPLVHGSWQQRNLSIFGKLVTLTLISRRSRRFAGTRYLKRGINQHGWVANEVETEQILSLHQKSHSGIPSLSSMVQLRGSIPLFWSQGTSTLNPKPGILLYNMDPLYTATAKHFEDLFDRYRAPVVVQNLVKSVESQPRETILRREFGKAIAFLNEHNFQDQITYWPIDFNVQMQKKSHLFLKEMTPTLKTCLELTGFCVVQPTNVRTGLNGDETVKPRLQKGVSRSNCIDCLDRTNIWQYVYGLTTLGHQLNSLGLLDSNELDPNCSLAYQLMEMYEIMGNVIALQYGGSEAHGKFFEKMRGRSRAITKSKELLTSLRRYYSNAISDPEKQDAINLFLGNFVPCPEGPALWELESDHFMHCGVDWEMNKTNFGTGATPASNLCTRSSIKLSPSDDCTPFRNPSQKSQSIQVFPVPVISQKGDPESIPMTEQTNKKESSGNGNWGLKFWFGGSSAAVSTKKPDFKLPVSTETSLESFEEIMKASPVFKVRLFDGQKNKKTPETSPLVSNVSKNSTQPNPLTDHVTTEQLITESSIDYRSQLSQITPNAESDSIPTKTTFSKESVLNKLTVDEGNCSLEKQSCRELELKSGSVERTTSVWTWFGGLSRSSTGSQRVNKKQGKDVEELRSMTQRTASTPANMGSISESKGVLEFHRSPSSKYLSPMEEFWDDYWSITQQSLTSELTMAEKASLSPKSSRRRPHRSQSIGKSANESNVFLDGLISQVLEDRPESGTGVLDSGLSREVSAVHSDPGQRPPPVHAEDFTEWQSNGLRSNINELLYSNSSGPGDRILEKWSLADKKAEADYQRNMSWIVSTVI
eukprot:g3508.t1